MRVLITRTDRMGDVILSIPAVKHLRKVCPEAYIAFMVASENADLVRFERDIDEVIVYDKKREHKSLISNLKFIRDIRRKKFDLAIALHPATRTHLVLFGSGISRRVGYDRKASWLLTETIQHEKQLGEKHEVDYNFDMLAAAGFDIRGAERKPRVFPGEKAMIDVERRVRDLGIKGSMAAFHTGASCKSKMWPLESFAEAGDAIAEKYSARIILVGDSSCTGNAVLLSKMMKSDPVDLTGSLGVSELAALFSKCAIVVSNDSGPAHLAAAVETPVVVIFGRNDAGLSPKRWAPVTPKKRWLHRPPEECDVCLAHNCEKDFLCLRNVSARDVIAAADELMSNRSGPSKG